MEEKPQSQYLKGFETQKILRPSVAYAQACESYPNRISELVFGSLLASYILGFVSVGTARFPAGDTDLFKLLPDAVVYVTISCSFSFLTAALYSVYHNSILTMPNVPISDLTSDFLIAISQAVFFGISMIWPSTFFVCLGIILIIVFLRQEVKFRALAAYFYKIPEVKKKYEHIDSAEDGGRDKPKIRIQKPYGKFQREFKQKTRDIKLLDGWGPIGLLHNVSAMLLILIGSALISLPWYLPKMFTHTSPDYISAYDIKWIRAIIYLSVGWFFFQSTRKILKSKSVARDDNGLRTIDKMDDAATELVTAIIKP